jgi:hypothetical protein
MKTATKLLLLGATAGASALLFAQDVPNNGQGPGQPGGGHRRMRHPPIALIGALDANHDGVIDADEIANAVEVLKKLDKNGDGKLTPDEFLGAPPGGPDGGPSQSGPDGQQGPRGSRGPRPDGQNGPGERPQRPPGE